jgi:hypothetical protein
VHARDRPLELVDPADERMVPSPSLQLEHDVLRCRAFGRGHVPPGHAPPA